MIQPINVGGISLEPFTKQNIVITGVVIFLAILIGWWILRDREFNQEERKCLNNSV